MMLRYNSEIDDDGRILLVSEPVTAEYGKRYKTAEEVAEIAKAVTRIDRATEEHVYMFCLDKALHMQGFFEIAHGTADGAYVSPREVFMKALLAGASGIILLHNHPSGDAEPSKHDLDCTRMCIKAGEIVCVPVLDHIIVGEKTYSMRAEACDLWD